MDLLSRIAGWLGENEATISAVVGIAVTGRGSNFMYRGKAQHVIQVSRELGARWIDGLRKAGWKG